MKVSAVIFDWGGTLTPWHTVDLETQWRTTFAQHAFGNDGARVDELTQALLDAEHWCWKRSVLQRGSIRIAEVLERAAAQTGMSMGDLDTEPARVAYRAFWEPYTYTDGQVRPLWTWLAEQGIKVGVLSNTMWSREYHRDIFERDGVLDLVDGDVYTSEIDWVKPHPEAFHAAAASVGVPLQECVYVGDRLFEDIHGPQQIGMRAIHVPHSSIPSSQHVEIDAVPDAVAHDLVQIAGIIRGWQDEV